MKVPLTFIVFTDDECTVLNVLFYVSFPMQGEGCVYTGMRVTRCHVVNSLGHSSCNRCPVMVQAVLPIWGFGLPVSGDFITFTGFNMLFTRVHKTISPVGLLSKCL